MKFDIPLVALSRRLPKTRFGKIMRRLLQDIASGQKVSGDTSTQEDRGLPDKLREGA